MIDLFALTPVAARQLGDRDMINLSEERIGALLDRVQAGDERSLAELYRAFSRRVYAFALNGLRDAQEAEQVVVDTMYEVWRQAHRFNRQCRFSTWLLGIARNKMLHALRSRRPDHVDVDGLADELVDETCDPFARAAASEARTHMARCLMALPEAQRECVNLVFYQGLSLAEVAQVQGCPENTVKTRLFKARHHLRGILESTREHERGAPAYRATLPAVSPSRRAPERPAAKRVPPAIGQRPLAISGVAVLLERIQRLDRSSPRGLPVPAFPSGETPVLPRAAA